MKIFISYSFEDKKIAEKITNSLLNESFEVLALSEDLIPGSSLESVFINMFNQADVVLFILSKKSLSSKYVSTELSYAITKWMKSNAPIIIPLVIEKNLTIPSFLGGLVYIDFSQDSNYSNSVSKLINGLKRIRDSSYLPKGAKEKINADVQFFLAENKKLEIERSKRDKRTNELDNILKKTFLIFLFFTLIIITILVLLSVINISFIKFFLLTVTGFLLGFFWGLISKRGSTTIFHKIILKAKKIFVRQA